MRYILKEEETSVISKVFDAQRKKPLKDDWCTTVMEDLEDLKLNLNFDEIKKMSENQFKQKIRISVTCKAMEDLSKLKNKHSKVEHIVHRKLELQNYLKPNILTNSEAKFGFHTRTRMVRVRTNYSQSHKEHFCPICKDVSNKDTQPHLLVCNKLVEENILAQEVPDYEHLFSDNLEKQVKIIQILQTNFKKRTRILKCEK